MADIGIDLGTTNSVLAYLRGGAEVIDIRGKQLLPSAVALDEGEWIIGYGAKSLAASIPENVVISPKRAMGTDKKYSLNGKTYTPVDISAMILAEIKKHAEQFLNEPVDSAIVTIPAHFNHQQVEDTKKAAEQAGLKVARLLQEPIAAAATYGTNSDDRILVFDMGGGTLDCTVVDLFDNQIVGLDGDNWLGGDDFDNRIIDRMCEELKKQGLDAFQDPVLRLKMKVLAEQNKINLSENPSTQIEFMHLANGKTYAISFRLTRKEYNAMIDDLVTRAIDKAKQAVARAGLEVDDIDVVLLVGGSCLTPYVQERLEQEFGKKPSSSVNPMLAVALGAAKCTRDLAVDLHDGIFLKLRSSAEIWSEPSYPLKGRTIAGAKVSITGGATPADGIAGTDGSFEISVPLKQNSVNDLTVEATAPDGQSKSVVYRIRHDAQAVDAIEPVQKPGIKPLLPHNILLGTNSEEVGGSAGDFLAAKIVEANKSLPTVGQSDQFGCKANSMPFMLQIPVYEGHDADHEIPVGEFNSFLGMLIVNCPPTPQPTPLEISFEIDDSRNISLRCWFKHDPSVSNGIKINNQALSRDKMHLIARTETAVNQAGSRIRPDEKARINRKKQTLIDMSTQFWVQPSADLFKQILTVGRELKADVAALEARTGVAS